MTAFFRWQPRYRADAGPGWLDQRAVLPPARPCGCELDPFVFGHQCLAGVTPGRPPWELNGPEPAAQAP